MLDKIKQLFNDLFSWNSFFTGLIGVGIGVIVYHAFKFLITYTFKYLHIFIYGIGVLLTILLLGYIMNKFTKEDDL